MPALEVGLSQADFYRERHGVVFAAMRALHQANEPIEHLTVPEQLQRQGQLEEVGGSGAIEELAASVHRWPPGTRLPTHQAALAALPKPARKAVPVTSSADTDWTAAASRATRASRSGLSGGSSPTTPTPVPSGPG